MKKKQQIEFKRKRNFKFLRAVPTVLFSAVLVAFFALIGYSVAKPFGNVGEAKYEPVAVTEPQAATDANDKNANDAITAYWLPEVEINDIETLERMLDRIGDSYNTAVIPLKIKGGRLNYNSYNEGAIAAGASSGPEIEEIVDTVRSYGYTPAASINTMNDNLYPKAENLAGFLYKKDGKIWFDAAENKGGKAWLAPSDAADDYLSALTSEIAASGFEYLIATNAEYPKFSRIGLDAIGDTVTNENRHLDLIDTVNHIAAAANSGGHSMWIEVSASEVFSGTCEVFQPMLLDTDKTVLQINLDDFKTKVKYDDKTIDFSGMNNTEKLKKICEIAETYIYKTSFIPEITGSNIGVSVKNELVEVLKELGYNSYIVR